MATLGRLLASFLIGSRFLAQPVVTSSPSSPRDLDPLARGITCTTPLQQFLSLDLSRPFRSTRRSELIRK